MGEGIDDEGPDINAEAAGESRRPPSPQHQPFSQQQSQGGGEDGEMLIWGTTVSLESCKGRFISFVRDCIVDGERLYMDLLEQIELTGNFSYSLDCNHLASFDGDLYRDLLRYPQEVIPIFDMALDEMFKAVVDDEFEQEEQIKVRPFRLLKQRPMRDLNPSDVGSLVSIQGMVTRASQVIPDLKQAFYQCSKCRHTIAVDIDRGYINEPVQCPTCTTRGTLGIVFNRSVFTDRQVVKLQETPDAIPEGETPQTVTLNVYEELLDVARPGDRVTVTGIFRANPIRQNSVHRSVRSVYRTYIDVMHFEKEAKRNHDEDDEFLTIFEGSGNNAKKGEASWPPEKVELFKEMASRADIYDRLVRSVAPSIWELDDCKKGLLCQLFGGVPKVLKDSKARGDINILLCGDPGTSKSQLLQYVHKLAPRGLYTSGKGSSAVGLTAYITRDSDTGQAVLESGALVLSDMGICCLDEMDKMNDQTRSILHEAMEQQTISIAKAGIICTLNARTSILASANPVESRYNPRLSVVENIQLPPTLLSRFDLIYLILDQPSRATDTRLAKHIVKLYCEAPPITDSIIDAKLLREYISFARGTCFPRLTDEAGRELVEAYVNMRKLGGNKRTITATPRQLESLVRLSEALAKMRLSNVVLKSDVIEATRLMRVALQQAAIDPVTGTIDMDLITTGRSATSRARMADLTRAVRALLEEQEGAVPFDEIMNLMKAQSDIDIPVQDLRGALRELEAEEYVVRSGDGRNPTYIRSGGL